MENATILALEYRLNLLIRNQSEQWKNLNNVLHMLKTNNKGNRTVFYCICYLVCKPFKRGIDY